MAAKYAAICAAACVWIEFKILVLFDFFLVRTGHRRNVAGVVVSFFHFISCHRMGSGSVDILSRHMSSTITRCRNRSPNECECLRTRSVHHRLLQRTLELWTKEKRDRLFNRRRMNWKKRSQPALGTCEKATWTVNARAACIWNWIECASEIVEWPKCSAKNRFEHIAVFCVKEKKIDLKLVRRSQLSHFRRAN